MPPPGSGLPTSPVFLVIDSFLGKNCSPAPPYSLLTESFLGKKNLPALNWSLGFVLRIRFPEISPDQACWPLIVENNRPDCLLARSPLGLRPKDLSVSRDTKPAGVERKLRARSGLPVMSVVTAFPLLEIFPQYTFLFPRLKKDCDAERGVTFFLLRDQGLDDGLKNRMLALSPKRIRSDVRGLCDG